MHLFICTHMIPVGDGIADARFISMLHFQQDDQDDIVAFGYLICFYQMSQSFWNKKINLASI